MTRMFQSITDTWNPYIGCKYMCSYCWARDLAQGRLSSCGAYANGFEPTFLPNRLNRKFKPGEFIFVTSMGDLFGYWVPDDTIMQILKVINKYPDTNFLLQTKNPRRFRDLTACHPTAIPKNCYLGATIESDIYYKGLSNAPTPDSRAMNMSVLQGYRRFISIEPIMDFDVDGLTRLICGIMPSIVEVGVDNHNKGLVEPSWEKVEALLSNLRLICPSVIEKKGLDRLKK